MDANSIKGMIESFGFPITLVLILIIFIYVFGKKAVTWVMALIEKLQNELKESYQENQKTAKEFAECINKNTEMMNKNTEMVMNMQEKFKEDRTITKELVKKVDEIQDDVKDIKNKMK